MAPARQLEDLECEAMLTEAACEILTARLDELEHLRGAVTGPEASQTLHDLRIAAKRVRYSLEMFSVCFAPDEAQGYADRVRELQDILGRIHDLDVLRGLLVGRIAALDEEAREQGLQVASEPSADGQRDEALHQLTHGDASGDARLGLYRVIAAKADERRDLYTRFVALSQGWEQAGLPDAIRAMIGRATAAAGV
jgi:hypothetical protein